jgi:hypothetical protein
LFCKSVTAEPLEPTLSVRYFLTCCVVSFGLTVGTGDTTSFTGVEILTLGVDGLLTTGSSAAGIDGSLTTGASGVGIVCIS